MKLCASAAAACCIFLATFTGAAANGMQNYFRGAVIEYAYGTGVTQANPRVQMRTTFCSSGTYHMQGRSCRQPVYSRNWQCSRISDAGVWQVQGTTLRWRSNAGQPGTLRVFRNGKGLADGRGNPIVRVGRAGC